MKKIVHNSLLYLSITSLVLLPGCGFMDWIKEQFGGTKPISKTQPPQKEPITNSVTYFVPEDGSKILASMDGRPLVTEKSISSEIQSLGDSNQELKMMLAYYGEDELKRGLIQSKVTSAIYQRFIKDQGIDKTNEYQQELDRIQKAVKDQFNQMYFLKALPVAVTEEDKRDWYENNKDIIPNLRLSEGGIKAMGISFESEEKAKEFLTKAQEAKGDLKKAAQIAKISLDEVKDFNLVHPQSAGIDEVVKNSITTITTFPTTKMVKTDKTYWVVSGTAKEEAKYRPFEQVSNEITQLLDRTKRTEVAEQKVENLRKKFNVVIAEEFNKPMEPQASGMPGQMRKPVQSAQPKQGAPIAVAKPA